MMVIELDPQEEAIKRGGTRSDIQIRERLFGAVTSRPDYSAIEKIREQAAKKEAEASRLEAELLQAERARQERNRQRTIAAARLKTMDYQIGQLKEMEAGRVAFLAGTEVWGSEPTTAHPHWTPDGIANLYSGLEGIRAALADSTAQRARLESELKALE
jgi:hypothetical protein